MPVCTSGPMVDPRRLCQHRSAGPVAAGTEPVALRMPAWLLPLALALAAPPGAAWAQGRPGVQLLAVVGDVRILGTDGAQRPAERGAELRQGETVVTGQNALAQLRLADGGLLSVRADTELKLDRFAFAGRDDRDAGFLASLLKGGFRAITGLIGQANRDGYRITTPSATIGIRGTDFETLVLTAPRPELQMEAGTFARVHRGEILVRGQDQTTQIVRPDQAAFVGIGPAAAPRLVPIPALLRTPTPVVAAPPPAAPTAGAEPGAAKGEGARTGQGATPGARTMPRDAPTTAIKPGATAPAAGTLQTAPGASPTPASPATALQPAPSTLQTAPGASPALTSPATAIPTAPSTTAPGASPAPTSPSTTIQTAPLQTAPPALQQAPKLK